MASFYEKVFEEVDLRSFEFDPEPGLVPVFECSFRDLIGL